MKGFRRYLQSPLRLALSGLACFGAGVFAAKLIGEPGLLFWWPAFALIVLAVAGFLRSSPVEETSSFDGFENVDKRRADFYKGWAHGIGPYAGYNVESQPFDISEVGRD